MALAFYLASHIVGSLTFHRLLIARRVRVSRLEVLKADLAGQLYGLGLPGGLAAGGAIRLWRLAGKHGRTSSVLGGLATSRLLEVLCQAVIASAMLPLVAGRLESPALWSVPVAGLLAAALAAYSIAWSPRLLLRAAIALNRRLPHGWRPRARRIVLGLISVRRPGFSGHAIILAQGLSRHLLGAVAVVLIAWALHAELALSAALWARAFVSIVMLLPLSIAGMGVREAGYVLMLAPFGVPPATALALGLLVFVGLVILALAGALVELSTALPPRSAAPRPQHR
jgi:uncharacterized membrane protein YbhN (UPF0104 family)